MTFNLVAPPGFQGLNPHAPVEIYIRTLPHWRQRGASYFVTFNLADALPKNRRRELTSMRRDWELSFSPPRDEEARTAFARTVFRRAERCMDEGCGNCWFRQPIYAEELHRSILHFHKQHYDVGAFVNMANHCHMVIRPLGDFDLEDEVGSMKSVTANFVNKREATAAPICQQESYDRIIRDEEHLSRVVQYIGANPSRAGIAVDKWHRWINPTWQAMGWRFQT